MPQPRFRASLGESNSDLFPWPAVARVSEDQRTEAGYFAVLGNRFEFQRQSTVMAANQARSQATRQHLPGVISVHELYTLSEARGRLGWTQSAFRAACRRGLRALTCGKRRYLTGQEILRFLEHINQAAPGNVGGRDQ